jgi:isoleucyl-tRNA synthetase
MGLDVTDRIELWWQSDDAAAAEALRAGTTSLGGEVLAVTVNEGAPAAPLAGHRLDDPTVSFWLRPAGA